MLPLATWHWACPQYYGLSPSWLGGHTGMGFMCSSCCELAGEPTGWQVPGWPLEIPTLGFQCWEGWGVGVEEE